MPEFVSRPGIKPVKAVKTGVNPVVRPGMRVQRNDDKGQPKVVRTVVRSGTIRHREKPKVWKPSEAVAVKRINPPTTVKRRKVQQVQVSRSTREQPAVRNVKRSSIVRERGVRAAQVSRDHNALLSRYMDKIKSLKGRGQGRILIIMGCGPSINEVPIEQLKGHNFIDMMSINKPDKRVWPTDFWCFCDTTQYKRNEHLWNGYNGIIINSASVKCRHKNQILVRNKSGQGFSKDLTKGFNIGRSTTYANMQTALYMDYDKVYIFGMDMTAIEKDGKKILHFYGQNPDVTNEIRERRFQNEAKSYEWAATHLSEYDRKRFFICSSYNPWGFVEKFNRLDHREAVNKILAEADRLKSLVQK